MDMPDHGIDQLRVPPHSIEAETGVLGALLIDNATWDVVGDVLIEADFYRHDHRLIFSAIASMINANRPADVITVFEHLQRQGKADEVGHLVYLNSLAQCLPHARNARRYAEVVRERSVLRKLVSVSDEIATSAFNTQGKTVAQVLDEAQKKVFDVGQARAGSGDDFQSMDDLMVQLLDRVQEMHDKPEGQLPGVPTGFIDLDRMTAGLQPGDLVVLAARPSMGKTAFAINIAEHVAIKEGLPVAVFSMEMGAGQLATRVAGSVGRINQSHLRTGRLDDEEWRRLMDTTEMVRQCPLHIDETGGLTINELRAKARRLARRVGKLGLIVVDYLQLMSVPASMSSENRATAVGDISRGLKLLAKELQCPVIALSQLNRSVEARQDKRPLMSDLRDSGAIEQDADLIWFIYRDEYYTKDACREPGVAEIIVAKQRSGPTGTVKLAFLGALSRFDNLAADFMTRFKDMRPPVKSPQYAEDF